MSQQIQRVEKFRSKKAKANPICGKPSSQHEDDQTNNLHNLWRKMLIKAIDLKVKDRQHQQQRHSETDDVTKFFSE